MKNIWFTSDHHFGHENIIKLANRPFSTLEEMEDALVENWNKCVSAHDIVYYLGDFCFYKEQNQAQKMLRKLNGQKQLILGNHDEQFTVKSWIHSGIYSVHSSLNLKGSSQVITGDFVLGHYPDQNVELKLQGGIYLHGHSHGNTPKIAFCEKTRVIKVNVCLEHWDYRPVSLSEVISLITDFNSRRD